MRQIRIGMVAGEASGDMLAAGLVRSLRQRYPDAIIEGIGGQLMQAEGFNSLFDMETLSVMGLTEVLSRLPAILKLKKALLEHFTHNPPDVFVGVDAPDFNLRIETLLKSRGIPTVHYVSPTVWAWREKRIHKIAKATSLVMGVFPFEEAVYQRYKVPYRFVGHTQADAIAIHPDKSLAREALNLSNTAKILTVMPGSRSREVKTLLPVFLQTMQQISQQVPGCQFVIPAANQYRLEQINEILNDTSNVSSVLRDAITVIDGRSREAMIASDAILLASGTASLEAMLCKRPMVVAYKMSSLTYMLMKKLYKPRYFALPNILANEEVVPELLQEEVNSERMSGLLVPWLVQPPTKIEEKFVSLHQSLKLNADEQAANAVASLISERL